MVEIVTKVKYNIERIPMKYYVTWIGFLGKMRGSRVLFLTLEIVTYSLPPESDLGLTIKLDPQ